MTVAEGLGRGCGQGRDRRASMGPQLDSCGRWHRTIGAKAQATLQWGRNLTVAEGAWERYNRAQKRALQWGRNLTVAEGAFPLSVSYFSLSLQWGRNLTVAEGEVLLKWHLHRCFASMGPQLDSCGRRQPVYRPALPAPASMGPQLDSCGRHAGPVGGSGQGAASMGPQLDSCGRQK